MEIISDRGAAGRAVLLALGAAGRDLGLLPIQPPSIDVAVWRTSADSERLAAAAAKRARKAQRRAMLAYR